MLAAWSGWGAVPQLFDEQREEWARRARSCASSPASTDMRRRGARRSTPTTPTRGSPRRSGRPSRQLGFAGGRVLEPGCGAGIFLGLAPRGRSWSASSSTRTTAAIARALYPDADIRAESFAHTRLPDGLLRPGDRERAVRRRAPARPAPQPRRAQPAQPLHPQVPALTRPGGLVAVLTLPLHARRRQPRRPPRDERPRGPGRRGQAADRRAPPRGRHRRADGPADPPPPPPRRARARRRAGRTPGWSTSTAGRCGSTATWPSTRSSSSASWRSGRACTAQTRCTSARTAASTTRPRSWPTRSATRRPRARARPACGPARHVAPPAAADDLSRAAAGARGRVGRAHRRARGRQLHRDQRRARRAAKVPASHRAELRALLGLRDTARALLAARPRRSRTPPRSPSCAPS